MAMAEPDWHCELSVPFIPVEELPSDDGSVPNAEAGDDSSDSSDDGAIKFGDPSDPPPMTDDSGDASEDDSEDEDEDMLEAANSEIVEEDENVVYDDVNQNALRECGTLMTMSVFEMFRHDMDRGRITQIGRELNDAPIRTLRHWYRHWLSDPDWMPYRNGR
jgi:hypothetical protein